MSLFRRDTLPLVVAGLLAAPLGVRAEAALEEIPLWPGVPPGGGAGPSAPEDVGPHGQVSNVRTPRLILHRPAQSDGRAVIVLGGGGYHSIGRGHESRPAALWLASQGVTAFELIYRLPDDGWPRNATFADAFRAVRLVRAAAARLSIDSDRVGMMGFSAGGHLAGMTAAGAAPGVYPAVDAADRWSSRPDFTALIYPILTMMPPWNHTQSFRHLLGHGASAALCAAYSVERQVTPDVPPVFLAQAADDPVSPIANSSLMLSALLQANLRPEVHIFRQGGHGWGMGSGGSPVAAWPRLFGAWLRQLA